MISDPIIGKHYNLSSKNPIFYFCEGTVKIGKIDEEIIFRTNTIHDRWFYWKDYNYIEDLA